MKVGLVGGTGNISSAVTRDLLAVGHEVVHVNRGRSASEADVRALHGDRHDLDWFVPAVRAEAFDAVIDFICFTPDEARASVDAFRDVGHVVHVSTVTTYGERFDWIPVTEDHPDRPNMAYGEGKSAADTVMTLARLEEGLPVTIVKPSTTYGRRRILRQVGIDLTWIARIRAGLPIVALGDGRAIHHFLHVDDAALAFVALLGREACIGQTYNLVHPRSTTWLDYQSAAMTALGQEVEQVGVPTGTLLDIDPERFLMARAIFSQNLLFSAARIQRDVPEFQPRVSLLDGLADAFAWADAQGLVPEVEHDGWEDRVIAAQRQVAAGLVPA